MERGYRYRIYPTDEQKVLMAKTFGCVRFVYNWGLDLKQKLWKEEKKSKWLSRTSSSAPSVALASKSPRSNTIYNI